MENDEFITKKQAINELKVSNPTFIRIMRLARDDGAPLIRRTKISARLAYYSLRDIKDYKAGKLRPADKTA
ncbi:hypothetical protein OFO10_06135 [Campylobacter sp. VBCF_06 NA8]|uniref:hypothetical protein n=1 Tax=Campylobacter sp. VBCF_06 NA8 TaxID=2983822 RepID=UPI0022E9FF45|nr:hypothetical protein [Campylobacter sp. VBCF_06 NA8]MDA3046733.1 hypothetical protein [Campylobacter sp. VBCF_06 NA8]